MRSFKGVKISGYETEGPFVFAQYVDENGTDWYSTRDEDKWGAVIMVDPAGMVISYTEVAETLSICEGVDVFEVDPADVPEDCVGRYNFVDGKFVRLVKEEPVKSRTQEDILADLEALRAELEALKG